MCGVFQGNKGWQSTPFFDVRREEVIRAQFKARAFVLLSCVTGGRRQLTEECVHKARVR